MVTDQYSLFSGLEQREQTLRLNRLRGFIDKYMLELEVIESPVSRSYASGADNIGFSEYLCFDFVFEGFEI
jgi:hypothetical protein